MCSFVQHDQRGHPYSAPMAMKRNDTDEPGARLLEMIEEFRVAKQRQRVRRGMARWNRAQAQLALAPIGQPRPDDSTSAPALSKLSADVSAIAQPTRGPAE